ncbi:hypothetical protein VTO42DRAFT_541 [Malbranchea cinnamomea]
MIFLYLVLFWRVQHDLNCCLSDTRAWKTWAGWWLVSTYPLAGNTRFFSRDSYSVLFPCAFFFLLFVFDPPLAVLCGDCIFGGVGTWMILVTWSEVTFAWIHSTFLFAWGQFQVHLVVGGHTYSFQVVRMRLLNNVLHTPCPFAIGRSTQSITTSPCYINPPRFIITSA